MIELGRKVKIDYIGTLDDGTVFDSSVDRGTPLEYIIGARQVIPGLDKAVSQMSIGETKKVRIPAKEAYGTYDESLIELVSVKDFPDAQDLPFGQYIVLSTPSGQIRVKVQKIQNGQVYFDHNHELAGKDLNFEITVLFVYGESGSNVGIEKHGRNCACGCDKLKKALAQ
jgi:FKBP-type peptidyl-prolyl cis-trans isomerase 2